MLNSCRVCRAQLCPSACLAVCLSVCQSVSLPVRMYGCIACIVCIVLVCGVRIVCILWIVSMYACIHACVHSYMHTYCISWYFHGTCTYLPKNDLTLSRALQTTNMRPAALDLGPWEHDSWASRINFTPPVVQRETKRHAVRLGPLLWVVGFLPPSVFSPTK